MSIESDVVFQRLNGWLLRKNTTSSIRRIPAINASIASDIGLHRTQNQDRVAILKGQDFNGDGYILIALSDGMGGMIDGEKCAAITVSEFFSSLIKKSQSFGMANDWLEQSARSANNKIYKLYNGKGGATLSAVLIRQDRRVHWLNVGDSRIYLHNEQKILQITKDDTIAGQIGHNEEIYAHRNELLQYIGIGSSLIVHTTKSELKENTSIVLTSDGVHYLGNDLINKIISVAQDPGTAAKRLIDVAKYVSGHDNCSIAIIRPGNDLAEIKDSENGQYEIWDPNGEIQILTIQTESKTEKTVKENGYKEVRSTHQFKNTPQNTTVKTSKPKKSTKNPLVKKTVREKDLLGDEINTNEPNEENSDPKFRMIFNIQEK